MRAVGLSAGDAKLPELVARLTSEMEAAGLRDMRGEGFDLKELSWRLDVILLGADGSESHHSVEVAEPLAETAQRSLQQIIRSEAPAAVQVASAGLFVSAPVPHFRFEEKPLTGEGVAVAETGRRQVFAASGAPPVEVPVLDLEKMQPGHGLSGPALLESSKTTVWVAPGWNAAIDRFANLMLTRAQA